MIGQFLNSFERHWYKKIILIFAFLALFEPTRVWLSVFFDYNLLGVELFKVANVVALLLLDVWFLVWNNQG